MDLKLPDPSLPTTQLDSPEDAADPPRFWLVVVHHPDAAQIGRWLIVEPAMILGRTTAALEAKGDPRLSRDHARLDVRAGALQLHDLESRNGTFVNGRRIASASLVDDDVVGLGSLVFVVRRAPIAGAPRPHPRVAHASRAITRVLSELEQLAARRRPLLLVGEPGTGKRMLAAEAHRHGGRGGALVHVPCASLTREAIVALGALTEGTIFLHRIEDTPRELMALLAAGVESSAVQVVASSSSRFAEGPDPEGGLTALSSRFSGWTLEVPRLRERREDIGPIIAKVAGRPDGPARVDLALMSALLDHGFPGNVRELLAIVERAGLEDPGTLTLTPALRDLLDAPHAQAARPSDGASSAPAFAIARDGGFFETADGRRTSLAARRNLRLLLAALAGTWQGQRGESLTVAELFAAGWPGDRASARAGASRVYVAMSSLRQLGLEEAIERTSAGYRLDPRLTIRMLDGE